MFAIWARSVKIVTRRVVSEQPAEPFAATDGLVASSLQFVSIGEQKDAALPLVIASAVVMLTEFG